MNRGPGVSFSELALAEALRRVGADRGSLMALDAERGELRIVAARGLSGQVRRHVRVPLGNGLSGGVAQDRRPLAVGVGTPFNSRRRLAQRRLAQSFLAPVLLAETVIGVINLSRLRTSVDKPPEETLRELQRIAGEFAPAAAYEWFGDRLFPAFPSAVIRALASPSVLTQALRTVAVAGLRWLPGDVTGVVLASNNARRPPAALIARRATPPAQELERRFQRRVEGLPAGAGTSPALPEALRLPELLAAAPITPGGKTVGWVCIYVAEPELPVRPDRQTPNIADSLARLAGQLFQRHCACRRTPSPVEPSPRAAAETIERVKFDALITTVCHEVNNPVGGILGLAELLRLREDLASEVRARLDDIQEGAVRLGEFTSRLARLRAVANPRLVDVSGTRMLALEEADDPAPIPAPPT